jgi:hypothetical protein
MARDMTRGVQRGLKPVGAAKGKKQARAYRIEAKEFTQAYQSDPVPVTWGAARRAGVYIFPVFAFRAKKVTTKAGK